MGAITNRGRSIVSYSSVMEFYYMNLLLFIHSNKSYSKETKNSLFEKCKKAFSIISEQPILVNNIDFAALSIDDIYVYGRAKVITNEFYQVWIKSALTGVLYELQAFLRKEINNLNYDNKFSENIKDNDNTESLTAREQELINYYKQGATSYKDLASKMGISKRGVKGHLENINGKLNSDGTGLKALNRKLYK